MTTLLEAVAQRQSIRKYKNMPLEPGIVNIIEEKIKEVNSKGDLHIQLITNEPKAFKGKMAYGTFYGVTNYIAMIGKKSESLDERIGYYGEQLVLYAQQLGLNTCWVGLTYNNIKDAYTKEKDEKLCCMIAIGYGDEAPHTIKHKLPEEVSNISTDTPEWFKKGVTTALLAPTAMNQQKFYFEYEAPVNGNKATVIATKRFSIFGYTKIDLGIAKCHFEIGADKTNFEWK